MKRCLLIFLSVIACFSYAQESNVYQEELIVTGIRASGEDLPGVFLSRTGDFLLLELLVSNDTRDEEQRVQEIYKTLLNAINLSNKRSNIELSLIQNDFVIPLTKENYEVDLREGARPDTSEARIRVKTKIPSDIENPSKLVAELKKFSKSIPVEGRVEIKALDETDVSVVNPHQYRDQIVALVAEDIKKITASLGDEYRVVLEGIDGPVQWARSGSVNLSLYIYYRYIVIPVNVNSVDRMEY